MLKQHTFITQTHTW